MHKACSGAEGRPRAAGLPIPTPTPIPGSVPPSAAPALPALRSRLAPRAAPAPRWPRLALALAPALALLLGGSAAAAAAPSVPSLTIGLSSASTPGQVGSSVQILIALTVLSLAPAVLLLMTSFTRIIIVLSFARTALGSGNLPPNQVLIGLALFLTLFVMAPTIQQIYTTAYQPYQAGTIDLNVALQRGEVPLRAFMLRQTRSADLTMFEQMQQQDAKDAGAAAPAPGASAAAPNGPAAPAGPSAAAPASGTAASGTAASGTAASGTAASGTAAVPLAAVAAPVAAAAGADAAAPGSAASTAGAGAVALDVLVPAFVISELRTGFEMGFLLFVPFVIIDLVVASTLMAMGMVMLPPMLISLPFKILLFVLVDGWSLLAQSLVTSFH